jgi:oligopeptide transport system ATP-binding protein
MKMEKVLEVKDLNISFHTFSGEVKAIRGVSFDLYNGETLAIVGESGSGKSVTTKSIMRLLPEHNSEIKSGQILFEGKDLTKLKDKEMQKIRGKDISMIFQDPMTSLNPTMKIGHQIMEPLIKHQNMSRHAARERALDLLKLVGIPKPEIRIDQYPHQFSGGMRQRVVIAIALACNPKVLIADEPTTALDVTIQAQILELMKDLQKKIDTSIIFITHDLGVVANVADRVAVMYGGKIVEIGTADEIFYNPQHPYTWGLISSMPDMDTDDEELFSIPGTPPDLLDPPKGDAFAPRNPYVMKIDLEHEPPFFKVSDTHYAATWLLHPDAPKVEPPEAVKRRQSQYVGSVEVASGAARLEKDRFPGTKEGK